MNLEQEIKNTIRDIPDYPKEGILFKDITPVLMRPDLCRLIVKYMVDQFDTGEIDAVVGIESRGFIFGAMMAEQLQVPFVPIRKAGKLPYQTHQVKYDLEYGQAIAEIHTDALQPGDKVLVHDDLLATGGTAAAASELVKKCGAHVHAYAFVIELSFLNGLKVLENESAARVNSIVKYD